MEVPRQAAHEKLLDGGRVNQKRRTREAIIAAAKDLLAQGTPPTVAQAAELAEVSRTTAYRYFPTQESLLVEVSIGVGVDDVDELSSRPLDDETAEERLLAVLHLLNERLLENEAQYRTALRLYLDMWLDGAKDGGQATVLREGRRRRWINNAIESFDRPLSPADTRRLTAALSLVAGIEAIVTMRDVCGFEPDEALDVTDWAAQALLRAALDDTERRPQSGTTSGTKPTKRTPR